MSLSRTTTARSATKKEKEDIAYMDSKIVPLPLNISLRRFSPGCMPRTLLTSGNLRQLFDGGIYLHKKQDDVFHCSWTNCPLILPVCSPAVYSKDHDGTSGTQLAGEGLHAESYLEMVNRKKSKILSLFHGISGIPTSGVMNPLIDDEDCVGGTNELRRGTGDTGKGVLSTTATFIPPMLPSFVQKKRLEQIYNSRDHGFNFGLMKRLCQEYMCREDKPCLLIISNCPPSQLVEAEEREESNGHGCCWEQRGSQPESDDNIRSRVQDSWLTVVSSDDDSEEYDDKTEGKIYQKHVSEEPRMIESGHCKRPEIVGIFFPCSPFNEEKGIHKSYFGSSGMFAFRSMFPEEKEAFLLPCGKRECYRDKRVNTEANKYIRMNDGFLVKVPVPPTQQEIEDMTFKLQEEGYSPNRSTSDSNGPENEEDNSPQEGNVYPSKDCSNRGSEGDVLFNILHRSNDYFVRYTGEELWVGGGGDGPLLRLTDDLSHAQSSSKCNTFGTGYINMHVGLGINTGGSTDNVVDTGTKNPSIKPKSGPLFSTKWGVGNISAAPITVDCGVAEVDLKCVELWCFTD